MVVFCELSSMMCQLVKGREFSPSTDVINKAFIEAHWVMERMSLYGVKMIDGPSLQN